MASIFSKIVAGEIPSYKCAEDENYYAFLDINPVNEGHTLVIPKHEVNYIFDLENEEYAGLWQFAKKVAKALKGRCALRAHWRGCAWTGSATLPYPSRAYQH